MEEERVEESGGKMLQKGHLICQLLSRPGDHVTTPSFGLDLVLMSWEGGKK